MRSLYEQFVRAVDGLCRSYLRFSPILVGKQLLWDRVVLPHTGWRVKTRVATTIDGLVMRLHLPDLVQGYIYYFGVWEPVITAYMRRSLKPGDIFVDVGANVGYYALLAARQVGADGRVHAIEPSPKIFSILKENILLNAADNTSLHRLAAGETCGQAEIFNGETSANAAATTLRSSKGIERKFRSEGLVDVAPLPDIVPADQLLSARLIKIDVEGAESSTIRGFRGLLDSFADHTEFIIELTEEALLEAGESTGNIVRLFEQHVYNAFRLPNDYSVRPYIRQASPEAMTPFADAGRYQVDILFSKRPLGRISA